MKMLMERLRTLPALAGKTLLVIVALIVFVYYPVGMVAMNHIDDSPEFSAKAFETPNGSYTVAMAAALVDREVNQHRWVAMDPFFYPDSMLVRMPAFQRGIISAIARFTIEMNDQIGRTRGSSQADADLQKAVGLLNYSPYVWLFDFSTSWLPTTSSATQYRSGLVALQNYNKRLSGGQAVFDRRADNLMETLTRIASDLGSSSAAAADHIENGGALAFTTSAEHFYFAKGRMYGNYLLLHELKKDFADIIKEKQLEGTWDQMLDSLHDGMKLSSFLVLNAAPDRQLLPNHLAAQGFFLMRARVQMYEIINILLK